VEYEPAGLTFVKNRIGSPVQAQKEIGFSAKIPLEQGLQELITWRRDHIEQVEARRRKSGI
ncbi:MAG TPA: hypothetical protein VGM62_08555, partial [Chthoniobacterales bacterium]